MLIDPGQTDFRCTVTHFMTLFDFCVKINIFISYCTVLNCTVLYLMQYLMNWYAKIIRYCTVPAYLRTFYQVRNTMTTVVFDHPYRGWNY